MKKRILFIGIIMIIIGIIIGVISMSIVGFDIKKTQIGGEYEARTYTSTNTIQNITIKEYNANIKIIETEQKYFIISYEENEKEKYTIKEENNTLSIECIHEYKWNDYLFNTYTGSKKFVLEVPSEFDGKLDIDSSNGKIEINDLKTTSLNAKTSNGMISIKNTISDTIYLDTSNGLIELENVNANKVEGRTKNGLIELNNVTASDISVITSNGKILLYDVTSNDKIYAKTLNSGVEFERVSFQNSFKCESSNGSVKGNIKGKSGDFKFDCKTNNGESNLPRLFGEGIKELYIHTSNGDINVTFSE